MTLFAFGAVRPAVAGARRIDVLFGPSTGLPGGCTHHENYFSGGLVLQLRYSLYPAPLYSCICIIAFVVLCPGIIDMDENAINVAASHENSRKMYPSADQWFYTCTSYTHRGREFFARGWRLVHIGRRSKS